MKFSIPVPKSSGFDTRQLTVYDKRGFAKEQPTFDGDFEPVKGAFQSTYYPDVIRSLLTNGIAHQTNIAIVDGEKFSMYRGPDVKLEGSVTKGVGLGVVIENDLGEYLLLERGTSASNRVGGWEHAGGTVELTDTLEQTVIDEALQETMCTVEPMGCYGITHDDVPSEGQYWINFTFRARIISGTPQIGEPHKCSDIGFFSYENLPSGLTTVARQGIEDVRSGKIIDIGYSVN